MFVVRTNNNKFAGFGSIMQRFDNSLLIHCREAGTWVTPSFRLQGVGIALWEKGIFPWCRKNGFNHIGFFYYGK